MDATTHRTSRERLEDWLLEVDALLDTAEVMADMLPKGSPNTNGARK